MKTSPLIAVLACALCLSAAAEDGFFAPSINSATAAPFATSAVDPRPHAYTCSVLVEWDPERPWIITLRYPKGLDQCASTDSRAALTALDLMIEPVPHKEVGRAVRQ